eukprot:1919112-Amphidinium_carterae.2
MYHSMYGLTEQELWPARLQLRPDQASDFHGLYMKDARGVLPKGLMKDCVRVSDIASLKERWRKKEEAVAAAVATIAPNGERKEDEEKKEGEHEEEEEEEEPESDVVRAFCRVRSIEGKKKGKGKTKGKRSVLHDWPATQSAEQRPSDA